MKPTKKNYKIATAANCLLMAKKEFNDHNFTSAKIWAMSAIDHIEWLEDNWEKDNDEEI